MDRIGFSTGSLARADVLAALRMLEPHATEAVELSALRVHELAPLLRILPDLDIKGFHHVSVHAPSAFTASEEAWVAQHLLPIARRGWLVILHPDTLHDARHWRPFGDRLCIENMDRRKPGRTVEELAPVFAALPEASFCLDVAHARQCDGSLRECRRLLQAFGPRLAEVHVSEVDAASRHVRLSRAAIHDFELIAELIPTWVPAIIEAPVRPDGIRAELLASSEALGRVPVAC